MNERLAEDHETLRQSILIEMLDSQNKTRKTLINQAKRWLMKTHEHKQKEKRKMDWKKPTKKITNLRVV